MCIKITRNPVVHKIRGSYYVSFKYHDDSNKEQIKVKSATSYVNALIEKEIINIVYPKYAKQS